MARFNTKKPTSKTTNLAGGQAFKQSDKMELVSLLLTNFVQDQFYRKADDAIARLTQIIGGLSDKKFAAKAILYARNVFGMRSITHVGAAVIANLVRGEQWTRAFFASVVRRPDDATEILSYYLATYGKPIPNALKDGLALGLSKFSDYQLAKYRGNGKGLTLIDAVNLVHVKPQDKNSEAFNALMENRLRSDDTWESMLTAAGSDVAKKAAVWRTLLSENKLGYFALLRNLRNIASQAPDAMSLALAQLTDEKAIKNPNNLVMPFRYLTAMDELSGHAKIIGALSDALEISLSNVPKFDGETLIALDVSGSMSGKPLRIGSVFAAVLAKANYADVMLFDTTARYAQFNPRDSVMSIANGISAPGGGTDFRVIFHGAKKRYDRIVILSDMQAWVGGHAPTHEFKAYKEKWSANPIIYSFDLNGHGSLQFPEQNILCLAGFNEAILDIMGVLEKDRNALINEIESTDIQRPIRSTAKTEATLEV